MTDVLKRIEAVRIVPVIAINDAKDADALAGALVSGGLPCAEVTFRTAAAAEAIRAMAKRGDILVGAGTVLTVDQAKQAVDCGAAFLVSPGTNPKVVQWAVDHDVSITPGIATPTDIELAMGFGLKVLKFFPAESFGGVKTLKAISAPYGMLRFIPTGGITEKNLAEYLAFDKVLAVGGSWMVKNELIAAGKFDQITELTKQAVAAARK
ncbi:MAG: bifunctional 4-hydroxy-2-oxoglutarate aldolase/2-dehydro-3-deoxy-phosphogluconate aldolase [Phycisphaeraceae bacterium]